MEIVLKDGSNSIVLATEGHNDPSGFRVFDKDKKNNSVFIELQLFNWYQLDKPPEEL